MSDRRFHIRIDVRPDLRGAPHVFIASEETASDEGKMAVCALTSSLQTYTLTEVAAVFVALADRLLDIEKELDAEPKYVPTVDYGGVA